MQTSSSVRSTRTSYSFFVTCAKGIEETLATEIRGLLGREEVAVKKAGVSFEGTLADAYRVCLWSRVANRVLLPLGTFACRDEKQLYGGIKNIRWGDHLDVRGTLAVDFAEKDSAITHTHFGALKAKDAIVDQFRSNTGERPSVETHEPSIRINVYLIRDQATVSLDLSGESLHLRGYRTRGEKAPLKETLAASILYLAGWPDAAREGKSLLDAMCGSGTIPLEAAAMAADVAPALGRRYFGFLGWKQHDAGVWSELLSEARVRREKGLAGSLPQIFGSDESAAALAAATENAKRAGFEKYVHFSRARFEEVSPPAGAAPGLIILNPPYGERLGEEEELKPLYSQIGDSFKKRFSGWTGFVITSSPILAKEVGLQPKQKFPLFNGALECRLFKYELYAGTRRTS